MPAPKARADTPLKHAPPQPQPRQNPPAEATVPYSLAVDVDLVNVNVVVTDTKGRYLTQLRKEDFRIYEDRVEQQITHFSPVDAPFAVGLILDTSYSTINRLAKIQDEAIGFIDRIHVDDEVLVVSFDDEVHLESEFTRNKQATERAIKQTRTGGSTQLYEAVYLALQQKIRHRRERKAMVLFTDGVDTASPTSTENETIELAREVDTLIYPIFFDTRYDTDPMSRNPRTAVGEGRGHRRNSDRRGDRRAADRRRHHRIAFTSPPPLSPPPLSPHPHSPPPHRPRPKRGGIPERPPLSGTVGTGYGRHPLRLQGSAQPWRCFPTDRGRTEKPVQPGLQSHQ